MLTIPIARKDKANSSIVRKYIPTAGPKYMLVRREMAQHVREEKAAHTCGVYARGVNAMLHTVMLYTVHMLCAVVMLPTSK
jgi:hypothetical protein